MRFGYRWLKGKSFYNFAQKLLLLRIEAMQKEQVPKCNYIKISDRGTMKKCDKCKICNPRAEN
jgi:hypothetical protein